MRHDYPLTLEIPEGCGGDATAGQDAGGTAVASPQGAGKFPFPDDKPVLKLSGQGAGAPLLQLPLLAESGF